MSSYVILSRGFALKAYASEQILFDLIKGTRYSLQEGQFDFLTLCDGTLTLEQLQKNYDDDSQGEVRAFLDNLHSIGAVDFLDEPSPRELSKQVVPDIGLQVVHLEARSACNLRCAHCYQGERYPPEKSLTLLEIESLADQMRDLNVQGVSISGGEPFLDREIFDIVSLFEKREIRVISFFTNGLLLDQGKIERVAACRSHPTVFVSFDAITPEGMSFRGLNELAGGKAISHIIAVIKMLVAHGINVVVNTVMNRQNIAHLNEMYDLIRGLGISSWRIGFPKDTGFFRENSEAFRLDWQLMSQASFMLLQRHFKLGRPFHLQIEYLFREELFADFQPLPDEAFVCDYERKRETCCVKPNGDVVSCAYCTDFPVGNIRKTSLWDVWYSQEMQRVKEIRIKDVKECKGCELRPYCATGCRANAFFLNGDFENGKDNYACMAVQFFVDQVTPFLRKEGVLN